MTTLPDGRFVFINENTHSIAVEVTDNSNEFSVLYAGYTVAFAFNAKYDKIAILSPIDELLFESQQQEECNNNYLEKNSCNYEKTLMRLRIYYYESNELTDMIDEITVKGLFTLIWVDATHLALSNNVNETSIYSIKNNKIRFHIRDRGVYPCTALERLGLINKPSNERQDETVELVFWWLDPDKIDDNYILPHRRTKRNNIRHVIGTCFSGNFVFVANNDASLHGIYITRGSVRRLKPLLIDIADAKGRSWSLESSKTGALTNATAAASSDAVNVGMPITVALSSAQVLVSFTNLPFIARYKYVKQTDTLKLLDLIKLSTPTHIVALSRDRYLIREITQDKTDIINGIRYKYKSINLLSTLYRDVKSTPQNQKESDSHNNYENERTISQGKNDSYSEGKQIQQKESNDNSRKSNGVEEKRAELATEKKESDNNFIGKEIVSKLTTPLAINSALIVVLLLVARYAIRNWQRR